MVFIKSLSFYALCFLCSSCAHFSGDVKHIYTSESAQFVKPVDNKIKAYVSGYASWDKGANVQSQIIATLEQEFKEQGYTLSWLSDHDPKPSDYLDIVILVDSAADYETREFDPVTLLTAIVTGLTVFVSPTKSDDQTVLVYFKHYSNGYLKDVSVFESKIYKMFGISMLPFVRTTDVGDDMAEIAKKSATLYFEGFNK